MSKKVFLILIVLFSVLALTQCRDGSDGDGDNDADTGDAGGDGDVDGDSDGDADPSCNPPSALGVCDPILQCGCNDGYLCSVTLIGNETVEVCVEDTGGTGVHGEEGCKTGTCAPGFFCRPWADAKGNPITVCRKWCLEDDDCEEYPGSHCNDQLAYEIGEDIVPIEPYLLCTPENETLGVGTADFTVCTGLPGNCPGNPPFHYEIGAGEVNGSCTITPGDPYVLIFNLHDVGQGITLTAYEVHFTPSGSDFVTAVDDGGPNEATRSRFSIGLPGSGDNPLYSTKEFESPPGNDTCELRVRYREADEGFDLEFTCNHIEWSHEDPRLLTVNEEGTEMSNGTLSMDGCLIDTE